MPTMAAPLFEVVLVTPQIPNNTGNIGRTCVAAGCRLHLVHPLGFDTSEKACRRAGLDYWPRLDVQEHSSWDAFAPHLHNRRAWFFSTKAQHSLYSATFAQGDILIFGSETSGLPPDLLAQYSSRLLHLPMMPAERCLNLATVVCAAVYLGLGQLLHSGTISATPDGRLCLP